ncbi:hypothetical protein MMC22_010677 [Lobaria immixta]|nr:hypothetical protein [Lobaria immixta]
MSGTEQELFSSTDPESSFVNHDRNPLAEVFPEEYKQLNQQDSVAFSLLPNTSAPDPRVANPDPMFAGPWTPFTPAPTTDSFDSVLPSATNEGDGLASITQLMTDVGLGENREDATMADIPASVPMPNFDDEDFVAQLGAASPQKFQFMQSSPHSTKGYGDLDGDLDLTFSKPGKRLRGRPKREKGDPKGPYPKGPKRIAAPADLTTIRVATEATVRKGVKIKGWYTKTNDGLYNGTPSNADS